MISRCQIKILLVLILCVLVQNYSYSQQSSERYAYSLEELSSMTFITIDRKLTKLDDVMGTVYSISHETIKKRGYQNLKDVLEQIPGFVVFHRDLQFVAGIRGLNSNDNEKITLLINGNEVNGISDPDFLNGEINFDEVERLEIVVGPSSFFQQVNTLAATINIITRQRNGASFTVTSGSDLDHRMSLAYGSTEGSFKFNSMLSVERYKGFDAFDNTESVFDNLEDTKYTGRNDNFWSVTTASYKGWSTQVAILRSSTPYLIAFSDNSPGHNYYIDDTYSLVIKKNTTINKSLSTTFTIQASSKKLEKVPEFYLKEYTYHTELGVIWENDIHEIKLGVQYTYKDPSKFTFNDGELVNAKRGIHTVGFYLHDTWQFSEKLKLINGLRIDKSTLLANHQWHVSGTSGLVYQVDDDWVTKLMYNVSTRMPSTLVGANDVWGANNNNPIAPVWAVVNDTADKPETLTTFEFQNILYWDKMRMSLTLYYQDLQNFISWGGPWTNLGDYRGPGVEGDIFYSLGEKVDAWFNFSLLDSKFDTSNPGLSRHASISDDERIIGSPRVTANTGLTIKATKNLSISPTLRYFTKQSAFDKVKDDFTKINDRFYLDVGMLWENAFTKKNLELRCRLKNLLNNREFVAGSWSNGFYKPRGVSFNITLSYAF